MDALSMGRCARVWTRRFFTCFDRLEFSASLEEASSDYPSSRANSSTSLLVLMRSAAVRRNFREYRFPSLSIRFSESVPIPVCQFKGSVHVLCSVLVGTPQVFSRILLEGVPTVAT